MITLSSDIYFNNCRECVLRRRARRAEIKSANLPHVMIYIIVSPTLQQISIKPSGLQITGVARAPSDTRNENLWWSISVGQVASVDAKIARVLFCFKHAQPSRLAGDFPPRAVALAGQQSLLCCGDCRSLTALPAP